MAGMVDAAGLRSSCPASSIPLYFELDGTFPNHPANPLEPENIEDLRRVVPEQHCDLGVAFDGDADRMFLVDEKGQSVGGDMVTAMVARSAAAQASRRGDSLQPDLLALRARVDRREGGRPVRTRVGHSFIKKMMREENAIFGGEHSGHFYFRDNWYADSGLIAFLIVLELVSQSGQTVSELIATVDHALP